MKRRTFVLSLSSSILASCSPSENSSTSWELFDAVHRPHWKLSPIEASGEMRWQDSQLSLGEGNPITGAVFSMWKQLGLPVSNYQIEFEASRVSGRDFFATLTFPIGKIEDSVSLVIGGWGGTLVGISCIDGYDASENQTTSHFHFQNQHWYVFKVEVKAGWLRVWQDSNMIIQTNLNGRQLSLRGGDIVHCAPFGFATYMSHGTIRNLKIQRIQS